MKIRVAYSLLIILLVFTSFIVARQAATFIGEDINSALNISDATTIQLVNSEPVIQLGAEVETRPVMPYKVVEIQGPLSVTIRQMNGYAVELNGDKSAFGYIETEVKGDKLTIKVTKKGRNEVEGIQVVLNAPLLEALTMKGSGNVIGENVKFEKFNLTIEGSGNARINGIINNKFQANLEGSGALEAKIEGHSVNINLEGSGDVALEANLENLAVQSEGSGSTVLSGKTKNMDLKLKGSGDIKASSMVARKGSVKIEGSGDCTVTVEDKLDADIKGSGVLKYAGKPKVNSTIRGSGRVERL